MKRLFLLFFVIMITEMFAQNSSANKTVEGKIIQLLDQADELKYSDWKKSAQLITLADKLSEKSNDDGLRATFYKKAALIYYIMTVIFLTSH